MYRGWTKIDYQDKHCITDQMDKGTQDDRGRDGRTNFTWRIKEQATHLTPLFEHDDDDDECYLFLAGVTSYHKGMLFNNNNIQNYNFACGFVWV